MSKKKIGVSSTPPQSSARPLGTKRGKTEKKIAREDEKVVDNPPSDPVSSSTLVDEPPTTQQTQEQQNMATLTLQPGKAGAKYPMASYKGLNAVVKIGLGAFKDKTPPSTIDIVGDFAEAKPVQAKMTAEERKAYRLANPKPKPTAAEKIAQLQKKLDALKAAPAA